MQSDLTYSILGAARSGVAVARLLRKHGYGVFVSDNKPENENAVAATELREIGIEAEFGGHTNRVLEADVLILSPGVPDTIPIVREAIARGMQVVSEIEIAFGYCKAPIVAITGTNGKTTTTELTGHIFRKAGRKTFVAGNVGLAFSEIVGETTAEDVVVLELSSFQLEHIAQFRPNVAMILNITPDHLDRYKDFAAYAEAKFRITMNQQESDTLILNSDSEPLAAIVERTRAGTEFFSIEREVKPGAFLRDGNLILAGMEGNEELLIPADEIRIRGPHNLANAMAASLAAKKMGVASSVIAEALRDFPGVPHRLEPVATVNGIRYVNDSKATNVDSLWYALSSFDEPIILIAGGKGKKNEYGAVLPLIKAHVKTVVLVGDAAEEMEAAFAGTTQTHRAGYDMHEAVRLATSLACEGDVILLSPACASFDMFRNYEHRGEVFRELVNELAVNESKQQVPAT